MAVYFLFKYQGKNPLIASEEFDSLDTLTDKTDMIEKLSTLLELPVEEYKVRETVSAEIHEILKKYYPDCLLVMFGSSVSGFAYKNCDLDLLFLPFPDYNKDLTKLEKTPPPDPESILNGETPRDVLTKLENWSHYKFLKLLLKKEKSVVKKLIMFPGKSSSLKIHLRNNKVVCDLHISNKLPIFNSELLHFLGKMDSRIKPLVLTLCYWARSLGFIKRTFFSNYTFTLLVIFYLQNADPPILPPIQHLIDHAEYSRISEGWQTAFATEMGLKPKLKNTKTLKELLNNFFEFYWKFDFVQNIISPNSGKVLPVKAVRDSTVEKMKEFEISSLNVQDPFMLSKNLCKIETETPTVLFNLTIQIALQMLQNIPQKYKFRMLFDSSEYEKVFDFHYSKYVIGRPKICFINLDYDCMSHLSKINTFSQQLWFERVSQAVYEVLQYGLLIECEVTDKMNWGKNVALAYGKENNWKSKEHGSKSSSDISLPDLELIQSVQCVVYSRTWMGRKKFTEVAINDEDTDDFNSPILKAEYSVSRDLIKKNPLLNRSVPLMCFKCDCYKHTCHQINNVIVMLKPLTLSREFYQVSTFLASYIPKTVKKILLNN